VGAVAAHAGAGPAQARTATTQARTAGVEAGAAGVQARTPGDQPCAAGVEAGRARFAAGRARVAGAAVICERDAGIFTGDGDAPGAAAGTAAADSPVVWAEAGVIAVMAGWGAGVVRVRRRSQGVLSVCEGQRRITRN
jgi:hypothetical protein